MRRILAFIFSVILLGVTGCAANPTPSATASAAAAADASATPARQWTMEQVVSQYLKTENGNTTFKTDAIKADYTQFQIVSADNSFNLQAVGLDKIAPMLDKLATVQMTEGDINTLADKTDNVWNLQAFTAAGKLNGDSVTIKASTETQIDIYFLVGGQSFRKVFTISDADGAALRAQAKEQARVANGEQ